MSWHARSGGDTKYLLAFYMIFSFIVIEWNLTYYESMEHENYLKLFSLLVFKRGDSRMINELAALEEEINLCK